MKKALLLTVLMTVWCGLSVAGPVTQQQALQKTQQFRKGKVLNSPKEVARSGRKGVLHLDELPTATFSRGKDVVHSSERTLAPGAALADGDLFVSKTVEGVEVTFKVISAADKTCQLGDGSHAAIDNTFTGKVTIPDAPAGFKIMKIASRAFGECSVSKIVFNESIADARSTTASFWFYGCSRLTAIEGLEYVNTSEVADMNTMFYNCGSLTALDLSHFDTANVTDMSWMFYGCSSLTALDLSHFNTSKVTDMSYMFINCGSLTTLDLSHFDTANVTDMSWMFYGCSSLTALDLSHFNTSKVTDIICMFYNCSSLTSLDLSHFNTSKISDMNCMFYGCSSLTSLDLRNFNTSQVTDMNSMFYNCGRLTSLDLRHFDTGNVTNMRWMFYGCSSLTALDLRNFNTSKVTDMRSMFYGCGSLTALDLSHFNTSKVTDMSYMFHSCSGLTSHDLSHFNTSNVENMHCMFFNCSSLTSLDLSSLDMRNAHDTNYMIWNCNSLTTLTLPAQALYFKNGTFISCPTLTTIISLIQNPAAVGWSDETFDADVYTNATLIVPKGTAELYKAADGWKKFTTIVSGETVTATITASGFGTFSSDYAVNFDGTDITPYYASAAENGTITMKRLTGDIAAHTGLYLKHDTGKAGVYSIPVAATAGTAPAGNLLKATTGSDIYDATRHQYVYASQDSIFNFYKVGRSQTVAKGKAYLETSAAAGINNGTPMTIVFDDGSGSTAMGSAQRVVEPDTKAVYNLRGQRVSQIAKGVYLMNGKKVIIK